jgi:hypothetical protein
MVALLSLLIVKGFFLKRIRRHHDLGGVALSERATVTFTRTQGELYA